MDLEPSIAKEPESPVARRTRELRELLDLNRTIINESMVGMVAFRAAGGECVLANEAAAAMAGTTLPELLALNLRELVSWDGGGLYRRAQEVLQSRVPSRQELRLSCGPGK